MPTLTERIAQFFTPPTVDPATLPLDRSVLYLLRRDINFCFGIDQVTGIADDPRGRALFPGVMAIMAGMDLLGKMLDGDDSIGRAGERFRAFALCYLRKDNAVALTPVEAWCLWLLRNSMLHSFGLLSKINDAHQRQPADQVRFVLAAGAMDLIVVGQDSGMPRHLIAVVDAWRLQNQFEAAVNAYHADLIDAGVRGNDLRPKFEKMWEAYAVLRVQ